MDIPNNILLTTDLEEAKKLQLVGQKKLLIKINLSRLIM
jgi:hypothetical protein